jgi:hypothetical protein
MFALNDTILLGCIYTRVLKKNAFLKEKKLMKEIQPHYQNGVFETLY